MMAVLKKVLWCTIGANVDIDDLRIVLIFCGAGLLLSLPAAMTCGRGPGPVAS
jgi:hypothetical protein